MTLHSHRLLILGGGLWQQPYVLKAKELGFEVFLTDWSREAPASRYADVFRQIDLTDIEATTTFAEQHRVDAVLTAADIGVFTAACVADRLGLRYHSRDLALTATDKYEMRKAALRAGLDIPRFCLARSKEEGVHAAGEIGFPLVIKPTDNCSSRGVTYVPDRDTLPAAIEKAFGASRSQRILVEEFMRGIEGSVEALVLNNELLTLGICDKVKSSLPYRYDLQLAYPGNYSASQLECIQHLVERLTKQLGIQQGIIHVEIMVGVDAVRLIEFAVRGCGSNVVTHLIPAMTGFDVVKHLVYDAFGIVGDVQFTRKLHGILKFIMLPRGRLKRITGIEEMQAVPGIVEAQLERTPGDVIGSIVDGRSRPGYVLAVGHTRDEVESVAATAINKLQIEYATE